MTRSRQRTGFTVVPRRLRVCPVGMYLGSGPLQRSPLSTRRAARTREAMWALKLESELRSEFRSEFTPEVAQLWHPLMDIGSYPVACHSATHSNYATH